MKVDGAFYELDDPPTLDKKFRHDIDVVVDRIVVRAGIETRLADSFRTALDLADGIAILETAPDEGDPERVTFSENFACPVSGFTISEIEPRLFSFNAPFGACPECDGLGQERFFDERLVVPDETLKVRDGAIAPWRKGKSPYFTQTIEAISKHFGVSMNVSWKDLPAAVKKVFLHGSGDQEIKFRYDDGGSVYQVTRGFEGVIPNMQRRYRETDSSWVREEFENYQNNQPCGSCNGFRLRPEALAVKIANLHVATSICCTLFKSRSFAWSGPMPEASLITKPFCKTLTRLPDIPRITGCPTAGPKLLDETPGKSLRCKEAAIQYAKQKALAYEVIEPKIRKANIRAGGYGENFATTRRGAWTH